MKNKTQNMYGKMAAMLMTVVLLTAGLSCTALAQTTNLLEQIDNFDPTFESYDDGTEISTDLKATVISTAAHGGNKSLELTEKDDAILLMAPVEPAKNYTFSFWMRNSQDKALQLQGGEYKSAFFAPAGGTYNGSKQSNPYLLQNVNTYLSADGETLALDWKLYRGYNAAYAPYLGVDVTNAKYVDDYTYGIARTGDAAKAWRKVSINFSTPPECVGNVKLYLACVKADEELAIDDLSLVETSCEPNFIFNGNMEAVRGDKDVEALTAFFTPSDTTNPKTKIVTDPVTNNKFLRIYELTGGNNWRGNFSFDLPTALYTQGTHLGTRYKISFKAKGEATPANDNYYYTLSVRPSGWNSTNKWNEDYYLGKVSTEWKTYTMYIDSTKTTAAGITLTNDTFEMNIPFYIFHKVATNIDDVTSWYDKSNIGFFKELDVNYVDAEKTDRYFDFTPNYAKDKGDVYKDIMMTESSIEAPSISDLSQNGDGTRTVITRAHYLPKVNWNTENGASTISFNPTTVTLLSSVYKYEKDANGNETKTLVNVKIASGTSGANGETIDIVGEITVPKVVGSERYEVEAIALDMNTLKPVMDKQILK